MKYIDIEKLDALPGKRLTKNDSFSFECRSDLDCFNLCCRNLNLFLYPYDIVRLKNKLGISSDGFLDKYVDILLRTGEYFPEVLLKMSENDKRTCPFLTDSGCSVYPDRPDACRTFPVEQGAFFDAKTRQTGLIHFFRPPDFCLGRHEDRNWTVDTWTNDQGAREYNEMTAKWAGIKSLFQSDPWKGEGPDGTRGKMAFMSVYNIDLFRDFVFGSTMLKRFKVKPDVLRKVKKNDTALLKLGFAWIKFYLWGIPSKQFKPRNT